MSIPSSQTSLQALAEAIAFLQGVGVATDPDHAAMMVAEQLALRGYSVQPNSTPILNDLTPETLRRVRLALGLTLETVACEAGLKSHTVAQVEKGVRRPRAATLLSIGEALLRLGARQPE